MNSGLRKIQQFKGKSQQESMTDYLGWGKE